MLCACVLSKSKPKCHLTDLQKPILIKISELTHLKKDFDRKFELLESAINHGKKISHDVSTVQGIETVILTVNNLKEKMCTVKVNELNHDEVWGDLLPLLGPAKTIQPLVNSLSFMIVAKKGLEDLRDSDIDEDGSELTEFNFKSFIDYLTTTAIEHFQLQWNPVFNDSGSLSVETMMMLLGSLKDQHVLDKELKLLEVYFRRTFSSFSKECIQGYVRYSHVLEQVQHAIVTLNIFGLADASSETMKSLLHFQAVSEKSDELTLKSLYQSMEEVKRIVSSFSGEELDCVIESLSRSSELLEFIEEIVDEDILFLIDAVEEHFDQFVPESSVSDLIEVHGFLAPLIKKRKDKCNPQHFLEMLKNSCLGHKGIAAKIHQCSINVNSLHGLYASIANRGEMTKEIIRNCLSGGEFIMSQKDGKCEVKMSYECSGDKRRNYSLSDLHHLRSRAHLIVTSNKNAKKVQTYNSSNRGEDINFDKFIYQVNLLTEISTLLTKLRSSGYVKYQNYWRRMKPSDDDLKTTRDELQRDLNNWDNILRKTRGRFYFLNYYRSDQLCTIFNFLVNRGRNNFDEVLSLIHFVDRRITEQQLKQHQNIQLDLNSIPNDNPELLLSTVGEALEKIFRDPHPVIRPISDDFQGQSGSKLEVTVTPGEIFVASLEGESPLTANVILTLYENTSNAFPEPYQIVFCSPQTTWEEIHLLLQRCFTHSVSPRHKSLFCIANVELLSNELQFRLVDEIEEKSKCYRATKENGDYQLALICRGGDHHHIVEQFAQHSHNIPGMTDLVLTQRLKSGWPNVKMITSTLPGLGKTEHIKREALKNGFNVATFSISGPFEPRKLIQRLKELKLMEYHCLHLDIGEVNDPLSLDTFLFQLILTGMVSAGNQFYHLPKLHIYIEIANTLNDRLRESLVVAKYFTRVHLIWLDYEDFLVSPEITSNVQVVCQYLDIFDRGSIESKEVHFSGPKTPKPLTAIRCRELLAKYFASDADITFTTLHTFLAVLAVQLLKFSRSVFFKIEKLKTMVGKEIRGVRNILFHALLEVSKQFASRALTTCRSSHARKLSQKESAKALDEAMVSNVKLAEDMVNRVRWMIKWEDNNHLLVVFHGRNTQAITAMYRDKSDVPASVEKLLKSQDIKGYKELEDFKVLTQEQLQEKLEKIACTKPVAKENPLLPNYALTPDNILKMILIILRVRVNVPIIIMGETGCGKTSLVRYLAYTCGVQFCKYNFHAGISEEEIITFIKEKDTQARSIQEQIWIFLDEINTCDHLGLISDIMCHHALLGRRLSNNLVFLAACNPYTLRPEEQIRTAGLQGKNITDDYSDLVYRVNPLPEAMIDYVWDYGSLGSEDEQDYIRRMVRVLPQDYKDLLVKLLSASQKFLRDAEKNRFCVSLRDVDRCIRLISWFHDMTEKRQELKSRKDKCPDRLQEYFLLSREYDKKAMIKSIVLALAHCYLSRLPTAELRKNYRRKMIDLFTQNGTMMTSNENLDSFSAIVRIEEEDYLDRMELPPGTARNAALRENVFVMLVCILNRIPIFVVGKPGCSKSLSIQLIRSNLRGRDSQDPWFKKLPQLYVVSYQGSESSTSEGIIKVFEKAQKYKSHNKDVLPVVLLDEVGLAENSKYNPLKVLHSLLEPGDGKLPEVAVVGISNWSLDAAKMNRAIHLSRPEPTKEDLYETGYSLHYADDGDNGKKLGKDVLKSLAESYFEYETTQTKGNFHGLRDYYSLVKSVKGCSNFKAVNISLQRNFGGIPDDVTHIQKIFLDRLKNSMISSDHDIIPVTELIQANLADPYARHLMLITSGDSAIGILRQCLSSLKKETITIYGSRFEEDLSEDYNYRILSRIILCMEQDCILILRDLESIYGSLYDMLNQNYAVVGNRKNCRVALGANSNPICQVNDGFRCIVLVDQPKVKFSDPPLLNRFEKQVLRFSDVLTEDEQNVITELLRWVEEISTVEGLESKFSKTDMFIGFHQDTLSSLVLSHRNKKDCVLKKCKDDLMWIASPDGVLRARKCSLFREDSEEVRQLTEDYFKKPIHQGFSAFIEYVKNNHKKSSFFASDAIGSKTVVMTFANIHTVIRVGEQSKCQVERLSAYKSEKQLAESISKFWNAPNKELLVLQCKSDLDGLHLLLARSIIEEKRNVYKQCSSGSGTPVYKHVCIVVHVQRGEAADISWQFSFLCGWRLVFLEDLEDHHVSLNQILGKSVSDLLTSPIWPLRRIAQRHLLWCFTRIKYVRSQRRLDTFLHIANNLFNSERVSREIECLILQAITMDAPEHDQITHKTESWEVKVACDRQLLSNSCTLYCAMEQFVSRLVRNPLAKIVYFLEKENAWPPHIADRSGFDKSLISTLEDLWCNFIKTNVIFQASDIPEPLGAESYVLNSISLDLKLPFSQVLVRKVDNVKELFLEDKAQLEENEDNYDKNNQLKQTVQQQQQKKYSKMITNLVPQILVFTLDCCKLYMDDIFDMMTADFSPIFNRSERVSIAQAMFISEVKSNLPANDTAEFCTLLQTFVWIYREQILDLLKMVECCLPFVGLNVLKNVTDNIFHHLQVTFVRHHETGGSCNDDSLGKETGVNEINAVKFHSKSNIDETIKDEEADDKELESYPKFLKNFGDSMVTVYCEEMLPSKGNVEKNGGLRPWLRNASLLLSLAFKICENSPAFHYLRSCVDFSKIILTLTGTHTYLRFLFHLNKIAEDLRPEYLKHKRSFEMITNQLLKPLEEEIKDRTPDKQEAFHKFSALFYCRCIDTHAIGSGARLIVEHFFSLKQSKFVMRMSPVILRLLMVEGSSGVFIDIITNPGIIEEFPCLKNIDGVLKHHTSLVHHDSYPTVMICDLIQRLLNFEEQCEFDDLHSSDCKALALAKSSKALISQYSEDHCGLSLLSAVAFLRGLLRMVAKFVVRNPNVLKEDSPYVHLLTEINSLINGPKSPLQLFFLKQIKEDTNLFDLRKLFSESSTFPTIKGIWCDEKCRDKAVFTSVLKDPEYEEAKAAYWKLSENDDSSMKAFLTKCCSSPHHGFALVGIFINMVYLKRAVRKLTVKEEQLVDWVDKNVSSIDASLPALLRETFLRVVGRREFNCSKLQLSPQSSVEDVEIALLFVHIGSVVATSAANEKLPFYRYITNSVTFEQPCVLAHCPKARSVMAYPPSVKESIHVTCSCGLRLAFKSNSNKIVCPQCRAALSIPKTATIVSDETSSTLPPSCDDSSPEWDLCTRHMRPAIYRALHLIVYSTFYVGIALGSSNEENLSSMLNKLHGIDPGSDLRGICLKIIEADLSCLMNILSCKKDIAIKTMHLVIEKSSDLISGKHLLGNNDCSTPKMCQEWEAEFSKQIEVVFTKSSKTEIKQMLKLQQTKDSQETDILDCRILELDDYPDDPEEQKAQLKNLYRVKSNPSLELFRAAFLFSPEEVQLKHGFLTLFFANFEKIQIIRNLHHLMKWTRLMSSALTHRISRKEALLKDIDGFMKGHLPGEKQNLNMLFDNFTEAWNEMCPFVNEELKDKRGEMPHITETSCVAYCLTESDCGIYLKTAIKILIGYQNLILDAVISLSSYHHPALTFLEKGNASASGIMSVSIQDVKDKEMINFQWSDEFLQNAQNNLHYGKGKEIIYDLERIEMELAVEIASGKCYLRGALNKFIFAKELFHSCGPLLTEIRPIMSPTVPEEVRKGLSNLKERKSKEAQELLQHIEVLIYLLKQKFRNFDENMSLEELIEKWASVLQDGHRFSPFPVNLLPEPQSSIKIKHIAALYEAVEDMLTDGVINGLADKFRKGLTEEMKVTVTTMIRKDIEQLKPQNLLKALRRFVFRYLSSDASRYWPEESATLESCLREPSLWFPLLPPSPDDIPQEITLKYIHSTAVYLEKLEKGGKGSSKIPGLRNNSSHGPPGRRRKISRT
ncbi:uncharacterized protein LOC114519890 [Dendronephthya gigantea]|uniref:uncharacterized protein LOC114519890 n=1 Tax=Dendronephthya gigantea TaxID=151771 RepID=UPI00106BA997|nr:uncharacterized protein LOC114519890 [Dendronephthya gigantea]